MHSVLLLLAVWLGANVAFGAAIARISFCLVHPRCRHRVDLESLTLPPEQRTVRTALRDSR